jgi:hypothetical protein
MLIVCKLLDEPTGSFSAMIFQVGLWNALNESKFLDAKAAKFTWNHHMGSRWKHASAL